MHATKRCPQQPLNGFGKSGSEGYQLVQGCPIASFVNGRTVQEPARTTTDFISELDLWPFWRISNCTFHRPGVKASFTVLDFEVAVVFGN